MLGKFTGFEPEPSLLLFRELCALQPFLGHTTIKRSYLDNAEHELPADDHHASLCVPF